MRTFIVFLSLIFSLFCTQIVWAQAEIGEGKTFYLKPGMNKVDPTTIKSNKAGLDYDFFEQTRFKIISVTGDQVNFRTFFFEEGSKYAVYNGVVLTMKVDDFKAITLPLYPVLKDANVVNYTVPIRLRGVFDDKPFTFEANVALQSTVALQFGKKTSQYPFLDWAFGIGIAGISLDPNNSNVTEAQSASVLYATTGIVFKPFVKKPEVNIGAFTGVDFLNGNDRKFEWIYERKAWFGIGLSIPIPSKATNDAPDSKEHQPDESNKKTK